MDNPEPFFLPGGLFLLFFMFLYWKEAFATHIMRVNENNKNTNIQWYNGTLNYEFPDDHKLNGYCLVHIDDKGYLTVKKEKIKVISGKFCKIELIKGNLNYYYVN